MARILLVDDEPDLLQTLGVLLKTEGHTVVAVRDGYEAMKHLQSVEPFDMMVTDLRMAPVDGLELIEMANRDRPAMDIVVVSAYLSDEMVGRVMALGAAAYVDKPFSLEDIMGAIREVLVRKTRSGE